MNNSKGEFIIQDELFMKIVNEKNNIEKKLLKELIGKPIKFENLAESEALKGRYRALNDIISIITNSLE